VNRRGPNDPIRPWPAPEEPVRYLEINLERKIRWKSVISFTLFYALVCAVLVWFFVRFTQSLATAIILVAFMVGYMSLMAWWAMRTHGGRDEMR